MIIVNTTCITTNKPTLCGTVCDCFIKPLCLVCTCGLRNSVSEMQIRMCECICYNNSLVDLLLVPPIHFDITFWVQMKKRSQLKRGSLWVKGTATSEHWKRVAPWRAPDVLFYSTRYDFPLSHLLWLAKLPSFSVQKSIFQRTRRSYAAFEISWCWVWPMSSVAVSIAPTRRK